MKPSISQGFDTIQDAIDAIANGHIVIVVDDEDRENEGDLVMAAHFATAESINFMIRYGKGLVCVPATDTILDRLELTDMVAKNNDRHQTAFTVSIDAHSRFGVSTGTFTSCIVNRARFLSPITRMFSGEAPIKQILCSWHI